MRRVRLLLKLAAIAATSGSTRVFYDRVSPFYELLFTDHLPHIQMMVAAIGGQFQSSNEIRILDIACGTGALSRRLEEQGFRVTGLDFSLQSIRRLRRTNTTIRLVQGDSAALPFAAASFDVVTCMGAWRHFPGPQLVLDEICRVLRPEGVFTVGYFPPKLGGLIPVSSGTLGKVGIFLYSRLVRLLNYNDRTDEDLERQAARMIEVAFANQSLIQCGDSEYLILAKSPR